MREKCEKKGGGAKKRNEAPTHPPVTSAKGFVIVGSVPIAVRLRHWCHRAGLCASLAVIARVRAQNLNRK